MTTTINRLGMSLCVVMLAFLLAACQAPFNTMKQASLSEGEETVGGESIKESGVSLKIGETCLSSESQQIARSQDLLRFDRQLKGGAHTWWKHHAEVALALHASCGDTSLDARLMEQMNYLLKPGNEPTFDGGYADQHQMGTLVMFALAKKTPRIWSQISTRDKQRIDLMFEASMVSSAFVTSDSNPFVMAKSQQYSMSGSTNINRGWNPNHRHGHIAGLLLGTSWFGYSDAVTRLKSHKHADFIARLKSMDLPNIAETYEISSMPSNSQIEATLSSDYKYFGIAHNNLMGIYMHLTKNLTSRNVNCGLNDGQGISGGGKIKANCSGLPNKGKLGMLKEFDSVDANGKRSSALYAFDGLKPNTAIRLGMMVLGTWNPSVSGLKEVMDRVDIAIRDFYYKVDPANQGYIDYSKGRVRSTVVLGDKHGHRLVKNILAIMDGGVTTSPDPTQDPTPDPEPDTDTPTDQPDNTDSSLNIVATASEHDGNGPENVLDGDLNTRWSAYGEGQYLDIQFSKAKSIESLKIAFYRGDRRIQYFEVAAIQQDGSLSAAQAYQSSGNTIQLQDFLFQAESVRGIRIIGLMNSQNKWNSITEVAFDFAQDTTPDTPPQEDSRVASVSASADDGNVAENVLDKDLSTRWSALGNGQFLDLMFNKISDVASVKVAFYKGDQRVQYFDISGIDNQGNLTTAKRFESPGNTLQLVEFTYSATNLSGLRIIGRQNSANNWNSLTEVEVVFGTVTDPTPDPTPTPDPGPVADPIPTPDPTPTPDPYEPTGDEILVSDRDSLLNAVSKAQGGETIVLKDGFYGNVELKKRFSKYVTLKAQNRHKAVFYGFELEQSSYIRIDGIRVNFTGEAGAGSKLLRLRYGVDHVQLLNCFVNSKAGTYPGFGIYLKDVTNVLLQGNHVEYVGNGFHMIDVRDFVLKENQVNFVSADSYKYSGVSDGLIENNFGARVTHASDGAHNDFMQFQGDESTNLILRGNVYIPDAGTDGTAQGIFGNLHDSLVEQNIMLSALPRGISVGRNMIVRNNTMLDIPGQAYDVTKIFCDNCVMENNIWTHKWGETVGSNIQVQHRDSSDIHYVYDLFTDFRGTGTTYEGLIPKAGSVVDKKGAYQRLMQLLGR